MIRFSHGLPYIISRITLLISLPPALVFLGGMCYDGVIIHLKTEGITP